VNLTQPAYICFNNHIPELKDLRNNYMDVVSVLISYKQAFANEALFAIFTKKLGDLLQLVIVAWSYIQIAWIYSTPICWCPSTVIRLRFLGFGLYLSTIYCFLLGVPF
jgi:hypothetical protein